HDPLHAFLVDPARLVLRRDRLVEGEAVVLCVRRRRRVRESGVRFRRDGVDSASRGDQVRRGLHRLLGVRPGPCRLLDLLLELLAEGDVLQIPAHAAYLPAPRLAVPLTGDATWSFIT